MKLKKTYLVPSSLTTHISLSYRICDPTVGGSTGGSTDQGVNQSEEEGYNVW